MESSLFCPSCRSPITETEFFCPHCGKKLKDAPLSTALGKQVLYYTVSILLPPVGLWWAAKYLKQNDPAAKKIGIAIIVFTAISLAVNIWAAGALYKTAMSLMDPFTNINY